MKRYLNLLPDLWLRQMLVRRRLKQWSVVWGLSALMACALWTLEYRSVSTAQRAVGGQERASGPLRAVQIQNVRLRERANQWQSRNTLVTQLERDQQVFRLIGVVSRSSAKCEGRIQVQKLVFSRTLKPVAPSPDKSPKIPAPASPAEVVVMSLDGVAADNLSISQFVVTLRDTGMFSRVDLKSTALGASQTPTARSYLIECTF